jgi:kynurenine formamidase
MTLPADMSKYILMSYLLSETTPIYGGGERPKIEMNVVPVNDQVTMKQCRISFSNHSGTHIDAPAHFIKNGKAVGAYEIEYFIFNKPIMIDCPKNEAELITVNDLKGDFSGADIIIFRTGFGCYRKEDIYCFSNPGIAPETIDRLRRDCSGLRAIGIDSISVSSYKKRAQGREAHRLAFIEGYPSTPLLLIEDMDLSDIGGELKKIYAIPLLAEKVDSMPCTVFGEIEK